MEKRQKIKEYKNLDYENTAQTQNIQCGHKYPD